MQVYPYLFFAGECAEALAFYQKAIGAEVEQKMLASDMPPMDDFPIPEDRADWIMHCELKFAGGSIMLSDNLMGERTQMEGASVMLNYETAAEARAVFDKLVDGGEATMPFAPTFWSAGFGSIRDKFGIRWMVGCDEAPAEG